MANEDLSGRVESFNSLEIGLNLQVSLAKTSERINFVVSEIRAEGFSLNGLNGEGEYSVNFKKPYTLMPNPSSGEILEAQSYQWPIKVNNGSV